MWTQLNLFDEQTDIDFAMSLTSAQLSDLKHHEKHTYYWIKQVRNAVNIYESKCKSLKRELEESLTRAKWSRTNY